MNFRNKKGQAAMEFLMTYGWAILIAIIAIAALIAFGVLNPPLQESCGTDGILVQGVSCVNVVADASADTLNISITNNLADPITFTTITFTGTTGAGTCTLTTAPTPLPSGATGYFESGSSCVTGAAGGNLKGDLSFTYSTVAGVTYPATNLKITKKIAN